MKKIFILLLILFITGCSSYTELNNLGVIHIIGIEKENNIYKLYANIIEKKQNDDIKSTICSVEGHDIYEAINNLSLSLNKEIYISHLDTLLINTSINKNDLKEIINYFLNNDKTREDFLVATSSDIKNLITKSYFREINNLIKTSIKEDSLGIWTTLSDVIKNYYNNEPIYFTNLEFDNNIQITSAKKFFNNKYENINIDDTLFINYLLNKVEFYKYNLECNNNKHIYLNILSARKSEFKNNIIISNEINVIDDECSLNKNEINKLFSSFLTNNLKKITNKKITIQNNIRSPYEN